MNACSYTAFMYFLKWEALIIVKRQLSSSRLLNSNLATYIKSIMFLGVYKLSFEQLHIGDQSATMYACAYTKLGSPR
jgi:hypothetical protein